MDGNGVRRRRPPPNEYDRNGVYKVDRRSPSPSPSLCNLRRRRCGLEIPTTTTFSFSFVRR